MKNNTKCCECGQEISRKQWAKLDTYKVVQIACTKCGVVLAAYIDDYGEIKIEKWV